MRVRNVVVAVAGALLALATSAGAAGGGQLPLGVRTASLTQDGQELAWSVELDRSFSPSGLKSDARSLCLLLEHVQSASVFGELCVKPPASGARQPQLQYLPVTRQGTGPGVAIAASITRSSDRQLTATFLPTGMDLAYMPIRWQVISTLRPPGCAPPAPNRIGCFTLFPAQPALARLHAPLPVGCVPSGPPFVNSGPTNRREIALTFDDGPWYDTPQFLELLEREHVVATFFEIGEQISTYGQGGAIERRMLADGDMIGDHTWSHPNVSGDGPFAARQISMTAGAIRTATGGFTPCLFRAPYGAVSSAVISEAREMGFTTIQWDIDPRDWAPPGTDAIYQNVVANAHNGAIIIQHDGGGNRSETLAALPREIDTLRHEGYQFVTVTQLLGQRLVYR